MCCCKSSNTLKISCGVTNSPPAANLQHRRVKASWPRRNVSESEDEDSLACDEIRSEVDIDARNSTPVSIGREDNDGDVRGTAMEVRWNIRTSHVRWYDRLDTICCGLCNFVGQDDELWAELCYYDQDLSLACMV